MNPSKSGYPHATNAEYERLNDTERGALSKRDAAIIDALRGIEAWLAALVRLVRGSDRSAREESDERAE